MLECWGDPDRVRLVYLAAQNYQAECYQKEEYQANHLAELESCHYRDYWDYWEILVGVER